MEMSITKAIIPAGGLGTQFLPTTAAVPKELLPVLDKPIIHYAAEEAIKSGIKSLVIVTGGYKSAIEHYFSLHQNLRSLLHTESITDKLDELKRIVESVDFIYTHQREPLGLGHAVWTARHTVGKENIAVVLPDDLILGQVPALNQLIKISIQEKCNVVAVQEVSMDDVSRYGIVAVRKQFSPNLFQVREVVEKPSPGEAPSNLAIIGRYVLSPTIFKSLEEITAGSSGEVLLTDAIQNMVLSGEKVFAYKIQGTHYDISSPFGLLRASISCALKNQEYAAEILAYLKTLEKDFIVMQGRAEALSAQKIKPPLVSSF